MRSACHCSGIVFTLLFILTTISTETLAQRERSAPDPEELAEAEINWLVEGLALSDAQADRIRPILLASAHETSRTLQSAHAGDWSEMRAAMQKIRDEKAEALRPFLTGEQYEHYLILREQLEEARRQQRRR